MAEWPAAQRRRAEAKHHARPGGRFPIETAADVRAAGHLLGHASPADRAFIVARAKAIGATGALPDSLKGRLDRIAGR